MPTLRWPLVLLVCLGVWLHAADALVATTVMPNAIAEIGGLGFLYWTLALYELGSIVAGAATGLLAGRLGLRAGMCGAASVYVLGCAASALTGTMGGMFAGRLVQGLGGGAMLAPNWVLTSSLVRTGTSSLHRAGWMCRMKTEGCVMHAVGCADFQKRATHPRSLALGSA